MVAGLAAPTAGWGAAPDAGAPSLAPPPPQVKLTPEDRASIGGKVVELELALAELRAARPAPGDEALFDIEVYAKAATWILRHEEEFFTRRYLADTSAVLDKGLARARGLAAEGGARVPWNAERGRIVRAYRSRVDGSVQPYGLVIPESYDGSKPVRLDVVLHGRAPTMNEVSFITDHSAKKPVPAGQDHLVLEVFGRANNGYRWAGETDVFEAMDSVLRRYRIDPRRIVLRGFSMGGAGAWHLGLHHPDRWVAFEAGAGFTETQRYANRSAPPPHEAATMRIYDAVDYARNAFLMPFVGYGGEDDPQLAASVNMREALAADGFSFRPDGLNFFAQAPLRGRFLVGPHTPHAFHPDSRKTSNTFLDAAVAAGRTDDPARIRFVTHTTKYNRAFWVRVDEMQQHYERAEVDAEMSADRAVTTVSARNVTTLSLTNEAPAGNVRINGQSIALGARGVGKGEGSLTLRGGKWTGRVGPPVPASGGTGLHKRRDLQGPIDDAFMNAFLCVRPTGRPMIPSARAAAVSALDRFAAQWEKWMRGSLPIKDDRAVTAADIADKNLILFGDPGSNLLIKRLLGKLPIMWTRGKVTIGGREFSAADHLPVLIYPNPLNPRRYVVINSGHTFNEEDFRGTNALLYPRLGDFAILKIEKNADSRVGASVPVHVGLFDDDWRAPHQP